MVYSLARVTCNIHRDVMRIGSLACLESKRLVRVHSKVPLAISTHKSFFARVQYNEVPHFAQNARVTPDSVVMLSATPRVR